MSELKDLLAIAERVAKAAGAALMAHRTEWSVIAAEEGREVKIDADKHAEALILAALEKEAPYPVISEEAGWVGAGLGRDGWIWAVDPLDGSVNYLRNYPHCAVSIALLHRGAPVVGVVECFALGEHFSGAVGEGAWLNGAPIRVSTIAEPASGILQTGVPSRASVASMALFEARLRSWRKIRMIGSAASALAYVAAGRAEAYRESGSMIWDVAAGCALVKAAGGQFTIRGELDQPLEVAASNGAVALPD
ncbi:MAG: inositol monophosphatase [Proteobacteria bacterium]|nr:inositol monophosphatase [Pseudomonadota bacterium]